MLQGFRVFIAFRWKEGCYQKQESTNGMAVLQFFSNLEIGRGNAIEAGGRDSVH